MLRVALAVLALSATAAHADDADIGLLAHPGLCTGQITTADGAKTVAFRDVFDALHAAAVSKALDACPHKAGARALAWVVFDKGAVTAVDAAGSGDRKLDACIARALKAAKLATSKARVAASVEMLALPAIGEDKGELIVPPCVFPLPDKPIPPDPNINKGSK